MKIKFITIIIITLFLIVGLSGCTNQKSIETQDDTNNDGFQTYSGTKIKETFAIDEYRGHYMSPNSEILLSYDEQTLHHETTLTVETIETFPLVEGANFVVGYDFKPDGTQFNKAVNLQMVYQDSDIPASVDEENLRIYLYENDQLIEIDDCVADPDYNTITGKIYHFCKYMVCSYTPGGGVRPGSSGYGSNHSAVYTFEVPAQVHDYTSISPDEEEINYGASAYAVWDPQPYVRYYELTIHFNGNPPTPYAWEKEFTEQGEDWGNDPWVQFVDNELLIIGDYEYYPGYGRYLTVYDNFGGTSMFQGKHGTPLGGFKETFYTDKCGWCYLDSISTEKEIMDTEREIKAFAEEYFRDWTVTVRPVT